MSRLPLLLFALVVSLAMALPAAYESVLPRERAPAPTVEPAGVGERARLRIEVTGVASGEGHILVALYTEAATWTEPGRAAATAKVPATVGTVVVDFPALAPGDYGIALLHDADDSGDMTTNFLGIPREAYGFGNDARGRMSAPDFEESVVAVRGETVVVVRVK